MKAELITSVQNPRIKELVRLREHRGRRAGDEILVDGRREIQRALAADVAVAEVFFCPSLLSVEDERTLLQAAMVRGAKPVEVAEAVLAKIAYGERSEGIVVTARRPRRRLDELRLGSRSLIGVIERLEKPGNLGAILRSADGAGVDALLAVDPITDLYGPNVIRSSVGTVFTLPLVETTAEESLAWLATQGMTIVAADPAARQVYTGIDLTGPTAVVFGNEAEGLTAHWRRPEVVLAKVPMRGQADSLNVSITAALFFYEALRQRTSFPEGRPK